MVWRSAVPRLMLAALSGLGMVLVCPPIGLRHLLWVVFVPALLALKPEPPGGSAGRQNRWVGYAAGWVMLFANFVWLANTVSTFSSLPYAVSLLVVVLFATVFALPYVVVFGMARWLRARLGLAWVVAVPALQVAHELLAPSLFPYTLGSTLYRDPHVWQLASALGGSTLSFLALLANCLVAETIWRMTGSADGAGAGQGAPKLSGLIVPWLGLVTALGATVVFGIWRFQKVEARLQQAPVLRVALLQQTGSMEYWLDQSVWDMLSAWVILTRKIINEKPDLVVWPEGAVLFNPDDEREFRALGGRSPRAFFGRMVEQGGGFDFLIGGGTIEMHEGTTDDGRQLFTAYNSCYKFDPDGEIAGRYDKMVPLPFGEYLPGAETFPFLRELIQGPGNFRAGDTVVKFSGGTRDGGADGLRYTFSTPICYEAILSDQMWRMRDVDLLVNITNDAWFGDTAAPHLHAMLAAVRAMELGRPMLRIAYTGVSFVVEPHGQILYETAPYEEVARVEEMRMGQEQTLYVAGGYLFPWLLGLVGVGALGMAWRREPPGEAAG